MCRIAEINANTRDMEKQSMTIEIMKMMAKQRENKFASSDKQTSTINNRQTTNKESRWCRMNNCFLRISIISS